MPDPSSGQTNRFYTREFFTRCRHCLAPGGIVAFRLTSSENLLTPPMERRLASICRAARAAFTKLLAVPLPGNSIVFLASQRGLSTNPRLLEERFKERSIKARLVSPPYLEYVLTNDRLGPINELALRNDVPTNTDSQPICYQYTILNWLSRFVPSAALVDVTTTLRKASGSVAVWSVLLVVIPGLFILARLRPGLRRALLAATAGFVGMILEAVLILHYQTKNGVLYQDIGFLLMVFMVGLAAGALAVDRLGSRQRRSSPGSGAHGGARHECGSSSQPLSRWWGALLVMGCFLFATGVAAAVKVGLFTGLPGCSAGLAATGFFVGGLFAWASLHGIEDQQAVVSPLYAADLAGGCMAAVLGTLVAIPALGLAATAVGTAALAAAAILLL
jgi:spermidine synthase